MENKSVSYLKSKGMKKFVFGIIVIAAGLLLLLSNLDAMPWEYKRVFFSWQMLLIAIGLINLASRDSRLLGWILLSIGVFFILPRLPGVVLPHNFSGLFWPVLIIVAGIIIISFGALKTRFKFQKGNTNFENGYIEETNIFGGSNKRLDKQEFKGGKITCIFGGSELDMTQLELNDDKNILDITCIFGGFTVIVPAEWKVSLQVNSILGGFSDKRAIIRETDQSKTLIITGSAVFGGGEIKSY